MVYIVGTLLRKAIEMAESTKSTKLGHCDNCYWKNLMLVPHDYAPDAIYNKKTRALMEKFSFTHGGPEYDRRYPDGIPTSLVIEMADGKKYDSGLVMYPAGHARNTTADLKGILAKKAENLGKLASDNPQPIIDRFNRIASLSAAELASLYDFPVANRGKYE